MRCKTFVFIYSAVLYSIEYIYCGIIEFSMFIMNFFITCIDDANLSYFGLRQLSMFGRNSKPIAYWFDMML